MSNVAVNVVRIESDAYDAAVKFANENDLKSHQYVCTLRR